MSDVGPARSYEVIEPVDTGGSGKNYRSLYVGTGGDVNLVGTDDVAVLHKNVQSGQVLFVRFKRVNATDTSADDLVGYL